MPFSDEQLSEEDKKLIKLYGRIPEKKTLLFNKIRGRKYFDSGDYALSQAGCASPVDLIGKEIPSPDSIPHTSQTMAQTPPTLHHSSPIRKCSIVLAPD